MTRTAGDGGLSPEVREVLGAYLDASLLTDSLQAELWRGAHLTLTQLAVLRNLRDGRPKLAGELAGTVGLMCGGIVHILVHELAGEAAEVERAVLESHAGGCPAAVATLIDGPTAGARLAVIGNELIGSLGDTDLLDRNVAREAQGLLEVVAPMLILP